MEIRPEGIFFSGRILFLEYFVSDPSETRNKLLFLL